MSNSNSEINDVREAKEFKGISFKNLEETCCTVQALFGKVIEPWRDVV